VEILSNYKSDRKAVDPRGGSGSGRWAGSRRRFLKVKVPEERFMALGVSMTKLLLS